MPAPTAIRPATPRPGCVESAAIFQDPLIEEPTRHGATRADRARYAELVTTAEGICLSCPIRQACLYTAVVEHDVSGYVAGTTLQQRREIRRRLGVVVEPEDLDTLAGVVGGHRQVDHDEVVRLRSANPHESLEQIAQRLGCSLSTIKRHLRRERKEPSTRRSSSPRPHSAQVLQVAATVGTPRRLTRAA